MDHIRIIVILACSLCHAQDLLTTEQANEAMRSIIHQLQKCNALDGPIQVDKGWIRMRTGPPIDVNGELQNSNNAGDFLAIVDFTIENVIGSHLFYATEGEASIDKPNRVGIVERHTHVYRIAKDGISLEDRTAKEISAQQEEGVR